MSFLFKTVFGCKFLGPTTCNSSFDFPRILNDVSDMLHEQESSKVQTIAHTIIITITITIVIMYLSPFSNICSLKKSQNPRKRPLYCQRVQRWNRRCMRSPIDSIIHYQYHHNRTHHPMIDFAV